MPAPLRAAACWQDVDSEKKSVCGLANAVQESRWEEHDPQKNLAALPRMEIDHRNPGDIGGRGPDGVLDRADIALIPRSHPHG